MIRRRDPLWDVLRTTIAPEEVLRTIRNLEKNRQIPYERGDVDCLTSLAVSAPLEEVRTLSYSLLSRRIRSMKHDGTVSNRGGYKITIVLENGQETSLFQEVEQLASAARRTLRDEGAGSGPGTEAAFLLALCMSLSSSSTISNDIAVDIGQSLISFRGNLSVSRAAKLVTLGAVAMENQACDAGRIAWLVSGALSSVRSVAEDASDYQFLSSFLSIYGAYRASALTICSRLNTATNSKTDNAHMCTEKMMNNSNTTRTFPINNADKKNSYAVSNDDERIISCLSLIYELLASILKGNPCDVPAIRQGVSSGSVAQIRGGYFRESSRNLVSAAVLLLGGLTEGLARYVSDGKLVERRVMTMLHGMKILLSKAATLSFSIIPRLQTSIPLKHTSIINFEAQGVYNVSQNLDYFVDSNRRRIQCTLGIAISQVYQALPKPNFDFAEIWCLIMAFAILHLESVSEFLDYPSSYSLLKSHSMDVTFSDSLENLVQILTKCICHQMPQRLWQGSELCNILDALRVTSWSIHQSYRRFTLFGFGKRERSATPVSRMVFASLQRYFLSSVEVLSTMQHIVERGNYCGRIHSAKESPKYCFPMSVISISSDLQFARVNSSKYAMLFRGALESLTAFPLEATIDLADCLPHYRELVEKPPMVINEVWNIDGVAASKVQLIFLALAPSLRERHSTEHHLLEHVVPLAYLYLQHSHHGTSTAAHRVMWSLFRTMPQENVEKLGPFYVQRSLDRLRGVALSCSRDGYLDTKSQLNQNNGFSLENKFSDGDSKTGAVSSRRLMKYTIEEIKKEMEKGIDEDIKSLAQGLVTWMAALNVPTDAALITLNELCHYCTDFISGFYQDNSKTSFRSYLESEHQESDQQNIDKLLELGSKVIETVFQLIIGQLFTINYSLLLSSMDIIESFLMVDVPQTLRIKLCNQATILVMRSNDITRKVKLVQWVQRLMHRCLHAIGGNAGTILNH